MKFRLGISSFLLFWAEEVCGLRCFSYWRVPSLSYVGIGNSYSRIADCGNSVISCVSLKGEYPVDDFMIPDWKAIQYTGGCGPSYIKADLNQWVESTNSTIFPCDSHKFSGSAVTNLRFYGNEVKDGIDYTYELRMERILTGSTEQNLPGGAYCDDRVANCHDAEEVDPNLKNFEHEPFDCDIWHFASVCFSDLCNISSTPFYFTSLFLFLF